MFLCSPRHGLQTPDSMLGKKISKLARGRGQTAEANCSLPEIEAKGV